MHGLTSQAGSKLQVTFTDVTGAGTSGICGEPDKTRDIVQIDSEKVAVERLQNLGLCSVLMAFDQ